MSKPKRKPTAAERAEKKRRKKEFIRQNADPIFLHQEGRWDVLEERARKEREMNQNSGSLGEKRARREPVFDDDDRIPF
jgi:hypothetical protein